MSQIIAANAFKVVEGRPVTSSRIVAEYFGKQHHHVVRDIRTLISQKPDLERNANFGECSETINLANGATRQVPFFWMDRKGFSLLAMGFTGAKALDFKCAFYDEFERMEQALSGESGSTARNPESRRTPCIRSTEELPRDLLRPQGPFPHPAVHLPAEEGLRSRTRFHPDSARQNPR